MKATQVLLILLAVAIIIRGVVYYRHSNRYLKQMKDRLKKDDIDFNESERPHY